MGDDLTIQTSWSATEHGRSLSEDGTLEVMILRFPRNIIPLSVNQWAERTARFPSCSLHVCPDPSTPLQTPPPKGSSLSFCQESVRPTDSYYRLVVVAANEMNVPAAVQSDAFQQPIGDDVLVELRLGEEAKEARKSQDAFIAVTTIVVHGAQTAANAEVPGAYARSEREGGTPSGVRSSDNEILTRLMQMPLKAATERDPAQCYVLLSEGRRPHEPLEQRIWQSESVTSWNATIARQEEEIGHVLMLIEPTRDFKLTERVKRLAFKKPLADLMPP
ncbi:hypothetical protein BC629DRAFT_1441863 [Irpex lacteus]|nr:hypothetical protein BC629DRAFT_1441863 [Irpex lacteus]